MCQTLCEKQHWIGNTACLFYNYDFISFPNCTGNVKYLRCHSSIIVGSLFMCLLYSAPRVHCITSYLLHDKVAPSQGGREVCVLLRSPRYFGHGLQANAHINFTFACSAHAQENPLSARLP